MDINLKEADVGANAILNFYCFALHVERNYCNFANEKRNLYLRRMHEIEIA